MKTILFIIVILIAAVVVFVAFMQTPETERKDYKELSSHEENEDPYIRYEDVEFMPHDEFIAYIMRKHNALVDRVQDE